ncbi:hypothetical protein [Marinobacter sp. W-8]|uniref:hypothetical protein n=1 Tax=Marinobacter sp. W-8 TaxID=3369658 RepID=UPI0037CA97EC
MKQKISFVISGISGIIAVCISIWGLIDTLDSYRIKGEPLFFALLLFVLGCSVIYTSYTAWAYATGGKVDGEDNSLMALQLKKKRLSLEKEISDLEEEKRKRENAASTDQVG